jgi:uncharacterized protein
MEDFLAALALLLVIEGLLFAAFPNATPDNMVRKIGLISAGVGIISLYAVRRLL